MHPRVPQGHSHDPAMARRDVCGNETASWRCVSEDTLFFSREKAMTAIFRVFLCKPQLLNRPHQFVPYRFEIHAP
jgi:hypothetical protein